MVAPLIADPPSANSITKHSWLVLQDTNLCPQDLTPEVVWLSGAVHLINDVDVCRAAPGCSVYKKVTLILDLKS